jgi:hypothetical protein
MLVSVCVPPCALGVGGCTDGTGLKALSDAFRVLSPRGGRVLFPALSVSNHQGSNRPVPARNTTLEKMYGFGFQHPSFPPSAWDGVGLVLGHPLPLFVWDVLEAFPNARVVLTVRRGKVRGWGLSRVSTKAWVGVHLTAARDHSRAPTCSR